MDDDNDMWCMCVCVRVCVYIHTQEEYLSENYTPQSEKGI